MTDTQKIVVAIAVFSLTLGFIAWWVADFEGKRVADVLGREFRAYLDKVDKFRSEYPEP